MSIASPVLAQQSLTLEWGATLHQIFADDGSGALTGGTPGSTMFSGEIDYFDTCGSGCTADTSIPGDATYSFSGGTGTFSGLGTTLTAFESRVGIIDEGVADQSVVDILATLGLTVSVGQTFDLWTLKATAGMPSVPADAEWGIIHLYVSSDPFTSVAFEAVPPSGADVILLEIDEDEGAAYSALGTATAILQGTDCQPGTYLSGGSCFACAPGTFSATLNSLSCNFCAQGTASAVSGASSCAPCAGGTFSASEGSISCFDCAAGTFSLPGSAACPVCLEGTASSQGAAECTACDVGFFAVGSGNSECSSCSAGTSSGTGSGSCFSCSVGTFNPNDGGTCDACSSGTVAPSEGSISCIECGPGTESNPAQSICEPCPTGTFNDVNAGICQSCAVGFIAPSAGSSSCLACLAGTSSDPNQELCVACDPGSASPVAGGVCELCAPGTAAANSGAATCATCPADTFSDSLGSLACTPCASGETAPPGSVSCQSAAAVPSLGLGSGWLLLMCMLVTVGGLQGLWLERED